MFVNNGEKIKNLIREYSSRIRECQGENIETELLYFLYECEVDSNPKKPVSNVRKSKPVSKVRHIPSRRLI